MWQGIYRSRCMGDTTGGSLKFYKPKRTVQGYQAKRIQEYVPQLTYEEKLHDAFSSSKQWRKLRRLFLQEFPLCGQTDEEAYEGKADSCGGSASHCHHIIDRVEAPHLALDWKNLQSLCDVCHNRHTAKQKHAKRANP